MRSLAAQPNKGDAGQGCGYESQAPWRKKVLSKIKDNAGTGSMCTECLRVNLGWRKS